MEEVWGGLGGNGSRPSHVLNTKMELWTSGARIATRRVYCCCCTKKSSNGVRRRERKVEVCAQHPNDGMIDTR